MLRQLLGLGRNPNRPIVDILYTRIVAAARRPTFYSIWAVPDTPLGRFEMLSLHMILYLRRVRGEEGAQAALAQDITDQFFADVDQSLRELGIGDLGIPKRMKKLARMFYGRAKAYSEALDAGDEAALAVALMRNVMPDSRDWPNANALAAYTIEASRALAVQPSRALLEGRIEFSEPAVQEEPAP